MTRVKLCSQLIIIYPGKPLGGRLGRRLITMEKIADYFVPPRGSFPLVTIPGGVPLHPSAPSMLYNIRDKVFSSGTAGVRTGDLSVSKHALQSSFNRTPVCTSALLTTLETPLCSISMLDKSAA